MKIGIISDSHDRQENVSKTIDFFHKEDVEVIIHCGDFCAPFMIKEIRNFQGKIHCVFGNIDDEFSTTKLCMELDIDLQGAYAEVDYDGRKISFTHMPFLANGIAHTGKYDAVFYGHNHMAKAETIGKTLFANPGNLAGIKEEAKFAIYDTKTNSIKHFKVSEI
jgi:uncharacterized protein